MSAEEWGLMILLLSIGAIALSVTVGAIISGFGGPLRQKRTGPVGQVHAPPPTRRPLSLQWMKSKLLLYPLGIAAAALFVWFALVPLIGLMSLPSGTTWIATQEEWKKVQWLAPWMTVMGAVVAAMLLTAFIILIAALLLGKVGWQRAATLAASLALIALAAIYSAVLLTWVAGLDTLSNEDLWRAVLVLLGVILIAHWLLKRSHSHPAVVAVRAVAVLLLLVVAGPTLVRWINSNTRVCLAGDAACTQVRAQQNAEEVVKQAQLAYARQAAIAKAQRDALRRVSSVCTGDMGVITLQSGQTPEINSNECAMPVDVVEGQVVFVSRWFKRSKPFRPGECINIDFTPTAVEAAPGYRVAKLHYAKCTGRGEPIDFNCEPIQKIAACS